MGGLEDGADREDGVVCEDGVNHWLALLMMVSDGVGAVVDGYVGSVLCPQFVTHTKSVRILPTAARPAGAEDAGHSTLVQPLVV